MYRRDVLGMVAAGCGTLFAGCGGSNIDGEVVRNETPLALTHEYAVQGTPSGTRIVVDVTAANGSNSPITPDGTVTYLSCTFLNSADETLHRAGVQPVETIDAGATAQFQFTLGTSVDEATRYELTGEWVQD